MSLFIFYCVASESCKKVREEENEEERDGRLHPKKKHSVNCHLE